MDSDGQVKYLSRKLDGATEPNGGIEHLVVESIYEEESHERKSSISFDKIKQISLTYSLQSEDEESPVEDPAQNQNQEQQQQQVQSRDSQVVERRESHGSHSVSPLGDDELVSGRKVSVIEVKDGKRQWHSWQPSGDRSGSESRAATNGQVEVAIDERELSRGSDGSQYTTARFQSSYLETNPFAYGDPPAPELPSEQLNHTGADRQWPLEQQRQRQRLETENGLGEIYFRPNQCHQPATTPAADEAAGRRPAAAAVSLPVPAQRGDRGPDNYSLGRQLSASGAQDRQVNSAQRAKYSRVGGKQRVGPNLRLVLYNETDADIIIDRADREELDDDADEEDEDEELDEEELDADELDEDLELEEEEVESEAEEDELDERSCSDLDFYWPSTSKGALGANHRMNSDLAEGDHQGGGPDYLSEEELLIVNGNEMVHNADTPASPFRDRNIMGQRAAVSVAPAGSNTLAGGPAASIVGARQAARRAASIASAAVGSASRERPERGRSARQLPRQQQSLASPRSQDSAVNHRLGARLPGDQLSARPSRLATASYRLAPPNQRRQQPARTDNGVHNQERQQPLLSDRPPRPFRSARVGRGDKSPSAAALIGLQEVGGSGARADQQQHYLGPREKPALRSLARAYPFEAGANPQVEMTGKLSRRCGERYAGGYVDLDRRQRLAQKPPSGTADAARPAHKTAVVSGGRYGLWTDLYQDEDDYECARRTALYATPVRSPRQPRVGSAGSGNIRDKENNATQAARRLTCDGSRRLNIFISSPHRRPKRRLQQQQQHQRHEQRQKAPLWTNSSPSTGSRQDSCYVSNGQPSAGNGRPGQPSATMALVGAGEQQQPSPASSIGSQSCWSNYGSYTRASDTDQVQVQQNQHHQAFGARQAGPYRDYQPPPDTGGSESAAPAAEAKSPGAKPASSSGTAAESPKSAGASQQRAAADSGDGAKDLGAGKPAVLPAPTLGAVAKPNQLTMTTPPFTLASPPKKPIKLRNLINGEQVMDNLHFKYQQNNKSHGCTELRCLGSMINAKPVEYKVRSISETLEHAKDFINNFYASIKRLDSPAHKTRLKEIEDQLNSTETYYLKETELIYGAKLAWRNASRCIGRIQWSKLQVFDARFTTTANEMFEAVCNHIKYATNKGSLRSAITILPQRVKSTKNDWRVWNSQLIGYAGYRNKETNQVTGDPANVEFTEVCQKLGWKGKGTRFDVLPIVLSAAGGPPQLFPLPEDLILRVQIRHPKFKCFEELGLQWYALPAVANMMLDVGGLQFTAAPFSGWYMVTEIGARDLGDTNRYNVLEHVAQKMGLNTTSNMSLWKDQALVELNIAVLDSFQQAGVTIVDHHTATDTFMTHLSNEQRLRGGCPADWVWLVPPMSGSATQVFHQEMVNYHLLPNYEYMEPVWKNYDWVAWEKLEQEKREGLNKKRASLISAAESQLPGSPSSRLMSSSGELTPRKLRFKEIARAVKFTSKLFGKALSRRIKATILYATETGKSERFANKLAQTFSCVFNVHLMSMSDYDMTFLEHEALLLVVTSTFGNGDPPESGELFAKHLAAVKLTGDTSPDMDSINSVSTNPFFQMLSEDHKDGSDEKSEGDENGFLKVDKQEQATHIRPLSNVRFGVFALGSTAYPHFCAYGRYVDQTLGELGAERILKCTCGDELGGQEKAFNEWSNQVFKTACDVFCLTDTLGPLDERPEMRWSPEDVRFVPVELIADANNNIDNNNINNSTTTTTTTTTATTTTTTTASNTINYITYGPQHMLRQSSKLSINNPNEVLGSKKVVVRNLMNITNKKIIAFNVKRRTDLHEFNPIDNLQTFSIELDSDRVALMAESESSPVRSSSATAKQSPITFKAGDHIAIYPVNKLEMVEEILDRMKSDMSRDKSENAPRFDFDQVYSILVKREKMDLTPAPSMTPQGVREEENWIPHDRLPVTSFREALTRYMDITSPPNQEFLLILSQLTTDLEERKRLQLMARNFTLYEEWKNKTVPTLLSVLQEFKTIKFEPALITQIPLMKPRFYSVSGTSVVLTVGVVRFKTVSGELREGLCSNYLNTVEINPQTWVYGYVRSAPAFHMPQDKSIPLILISAGTGMAPFRAFWQRRWEDMRRQQAALSMQQSGRSGTLMEQKFGRIEMYFGCRNSDYILYKDELDEMYEKGVLSSINIAFSRPRDCDVWDEDFKSANSSGSTLPSAKSSRVATIRQARRKMYVQDKLLEDSDEIYRSIMLDGAHIYVCGDVAMADGVYKTIASIFNNSFKANKFSDNCDPSSSDNAIASGLSGGGNGGGLAKSSDDGESVLMNLRNLNRYHEDIFGAKQMS